MKQENKKLIQNLKTKNLNLKTKNLNLNKKTKHKLKICKKLPEQSDFTIGELQLQLLQFELFQNEGCYFFILFFTNLLIMFV